MTNSIEDGVYRVEVAHISLENDSFSNPKKYNSWIDITLNVLDGPRWNYQLHDSIATDKMDAARWNPDTVKLAAYNKAAGINLTAPEVCNCPLFDVQILVFVLAGKVVAVGECNLTSLPIGARQYACPYGEADQAA